MMTTHLRKDNTMYNDRKKPNPVVEIITTIVSIPLLALWSLFD
jgi:hypothetical protein